MKQKSYFMPVVQQEGAGWHGIIYNILIYALNNEL